MQGLRKNIYQLENFILSHSIDFMGAVEVHITNYTQTPEIPTVNQLLVLKGVWA